MDDENLFEINLTDWTWRWDFIDFWAQPLSQRGVKPEKDDNIPSPEKDQRFIFFLISPPRQSNYRFHGRKVTTYFPASFLKKELHRINMKFLL